MHHSLVSLWLPIASSLKSITYDNGSENTQHLLTNKSLMTSSFFARPYRSCDKGSVEEINSLIRRFVPKKSDLSLLSHSFIANLNHHLNSRPRKCLGYATPIEALASEFGVALTP